MITRRSLAAGVLLAGGGCAALGGRALAPDAAQVWTFDNLQEVSGLPLEVAGAPQVVASPWGHAVAFDGVDDALYVDLHPLAGAAAFTFEALFRPEGGAFEQRWFHLQEIGADGQATDTRILFEIRTRDGEWWLDAFAKGPGYNHTLITEAKRFPVGRWYHVAQTFDGRLYSSFVDGVLQDQAALAYLPQGPGRCSIGRRYNGVSPFRGSVRAAAFSRRARAPADYVLPTA
ncbi:LamG domain-containing protein [Pseudomonas sp. ODNR1LW]|nr:LamG domain-containing protein [Pseudomonas sp. ODNR1LW]